MPPQDRRPQLSPVQTAESWLAFATRLGAFLIGCAILLHETFAAGPAEPYLVVAGVGALGPVVAQSVATVFASIRGGGDE